MLPYSAGNLYYCSLNYTHFKELVFLNAKYISMLINI
jgi:hypothetical protein